MKKFLLLLLGVLVALPGLCTDITSGDFTFTVVDDDPGTCVLTHSASGGDVQIPETVKIWDAGASEYREYTVVGIAERVFENRSNLTSVNIPSTVRTIGARAFYKCTNLKSIILPEGVTSIEESTFYWCENLVSVTLPENLMSIGKNAFSDCRKLASVDIPATVNSIGSGAFWNCYALESIVIPEGVTTIESSTFDGCNALHNVEIKGEVTSIGSFAFAYTDLTEFTMPPLVTAIEDGTFYFSELQEIIIPEGITSIGRETFYNCVHLRDVSIPESVATIGEKAFSSCTSLEKIIIPSKVTTVEAQLFRDCTSLRDVRFMGEVTTIGPWAFSGCHTLYDLTLPSSVTTIESYAFYNSALKNITLPTSLTTIERYAFSLCGYLANITFPTSLTTIGDLAFGDCTALTSVVIPPNVETIGEDAFYGCNTLVKSAYPSTMTNPFSNGDMIAYDPNGAVLEEGSIYGSGKSSILFVPCSVSGDYVVPSTVKSIGASAFSYCDEITSVTFQGALNSIADEAFKGCTKLGALVFETSETGEKLIVGESVFDSAPLKSIALGRDIICSATASATPFYNKTILTDLVINEGVTAIADNAFSGCSSLTSLEIPSSVLTVGNSAFAGCRITDLTLKAAEAAITIGDNSFEKRFVSLNLCRDWTSATRYFASEALKTLKLGGNLSEIPASAFSGCTYLASLEISGAVASIGDNAFSGCRRLTSLEISGAVASIGNNAFSDCTSLASLEILSGVKAIGANAFRNTAALTTLQLHEGLENIGEGAFCQSAPRDMDAVYIPSTMKSIGNDAFLNFNAERVDIHAIGPWFDIEFGNLAANPIVSSKAKLYIDGVPVAEVVIPDGVTEISPYALYGLTSLTSLSFPGSVTAIGNEAFKGCTQLQTVEFALSETGAKLVMGDHVFDSAPLQSVKLGRDINCAAQYTDGMPFAHKETLVDLEIREGVTEIESYAFYYCTGLTELSVPSSVTIIGKRAFYGDTGLTSAIVPPAVTSLGDEAFYGCNALVKSAYPSTLTNPFSRGVGVAYDPEGAMVENGWIYNTDKTEIRFAPVSVTADYVIPETVTAIGNNAFESCTALTSLTIPGATRSIGDGAFKGCTKLTSLDFAFSPAGEALEMGASAFASAPLQSVALGRDLHCAGTASATPFYNKTSLTDLEIREGVTAIDANAFYGCRGVQKLVIPASVLTVGDGAFSGCDISDLILSDSESAISFGANTFEKRIATLYAGRDWNSTTQDFASSYLTSLEIGGNVTAIPASAFSGCSALTEVEIPAGVKSIGDRAFYGTSRLNSIALNEGLETIGADAFRQTSDRTASAIHIPSTVKSIGTDAFFNFTARQVEISDIAAWAGIEFANYPANPLHNSKKLYLDGEPVTDICIPDGVAEIKPYAFYNCSTLTSVVVPPSVEAVGDQAFYGCSNLEKSAFPSTVTNTPGYGVRIAYDPVGATVADGIVYTADMTGVAYVPMNFEGVFTMPATVGNIGDNAFKYCPGITRIDLDASLTSVGTEAFSGCSGLTEVMLPPLTSAVGANAFNGCTGLKKCAYPAGLANPFASPVAAYAYEPEGAVIENGLILNSGKTNVAYGSLLLAGEVVIPSQVSTISDRAFRLCSEVTAVSALPATPAVMPDNAFEGLYDTATLNVADATLADYMSTNWSLFRNMYLADSGVESGIYSDGVLVYRLLPAPEGSEENNLAIVIKGDYSSLTEVTVPERFTYDPDGARVRYYVDGVGYGAFRDCTGLTSVTFNRRSTARKIGEYAFANTGLSCISLPSTVESIDAYAFSGNKSLASFTVGEKVTQLGHHAFADCPALAEVVMQKGLAVIGDYAFSNCTALSEVSVPGSVQSLGAYAFTDCAALAAVSLEEGLGAIGDHAFSNCTALSEVNVPGSVSAVGAYAFTGCSELASAALAEGVDAIGDHAFYRCAKLAGVTLPSTLTKIGVSAFEECGALAAIEVPGSVVAISDKAFYHTPSLTEVKLNEGLEAIGEYAFTQNYSTPATVGALTIPTTLSFVGKQAFAHLKASKVEISDLTAWCMIDFEDQFSNPLASSTEKLHLDGQLITELQIPAGITEIRKNAFFHQEPLTKLVLPEGLRRIETDAFGYCLNLTEITIPGSVDEIEERAFDYDRVITSVTFADGLTPIVLGNRAIDTDIVNLSWGRPLDGLNFPLTKLASLTIGNCVAEIPASKFSNVTTLTEVKLGNSLAMIGEQAFSGCTGLTEVVMPPSLETIGASAFASCGGLASIIMGHRLHTIGEKAFDGCQASTVSITAQTPPSAPNNTFSNYNGNLYVQGEDAADAYYDAYTCWDRFDGIVMIVAEELKIGDGLTSISGAPGDRFRLTAALYPENVTLPHIFWRSTNPEIATVDHDGIVTLRAPLDEIMAADYDGPAGAPDSGCRIIAESLYAEGPVASVSVNTTTTDMDITDGFRCGGIDYDAPYDVYNLSGMRVADSISRVVPGIYIVRQGLVVEKIAVR